MSSSRRRAPSCSPRASRSWRTPTTSATSRCSARPCARRSSTSRCRSLAHPLAQPDKGSGIAMICTFGDVTDIIWWRELDLPNRTILGQDGRIIAEAPDVDHDGCREGGLRRTRGQDGVQRQEARRRAAPGVRRAHRRPEALHARREVLREGRPPARDRLDAPVVHPKRRPRRAAARQAHRARPRGVVASRLHARALRELDQRPHRRLARLAPALLRRADPRLVRARRERRTRLRPRAHARRRPLPDRPDARRAARLHAPSSAASPAASTAELDIFDTWATSSLTPQLAGGWERDPELWNLVAPFDVRPQGQDIIRTWLFSTLLRSALEDDRAPWTDAAISGFIVDPDRKKMSKSKGNVVTPADILAQHGSDAVRYWAASSRLGTDAAFDPQNPTQIKIGRRLAIKVLNAAKFVLSFPVPEGAEVTHALDASMLATLDGVVRDATKALDAYDHARALEVAESFFWTFCDDYLELVKERAYDRTDVGQASAALALRIALVDAAAPVRPGPRVRGGGVVVVVQRRIGAHRAVAGAARHRRRPRGAHRRRARRSIGIRRAKTEAKASQKTAVTRMTIAAPAASDRRSEARGGRPQGRRPHRRDHLRGCRDHRGPRHRTRPAGGLTCSSAPAGPPVTQPPASVPAALRAQIAARRGGAPRRRARSAGAALDAHLARGPADRRARHRGDRHARRRRRGGRHPRRRGRIRLAGIPRARRASAPAAFVPTISSRLATERATKIDAAADDQREPQVVARDPAAEHGRDREQPPREHPDDPEHASEQVRRHDLLAQRAPRHVPDRDREGAQREAATAVKTSGASRSAASRARRRSSRRA